MVDENAIIGKIKKTVFHRLKANDNFQNKKDYQDDATECVYFELQDPILSTNPSGASLRIQTTF